MALNIIGSLPSYSSKGYEPNYFFLSTVFWNTRQYSEHVTRFTESTSKYMYRTACYVAYSRLLPQCLPGSLAFSYTRETFATNTPKADSSPTRCRYLTTFRDNVLWVQCSVRPLLWSSHCLVDLDEAMPGTTTFHG